MPVIQVDNLSFSYGSGDILSSVSFSVEQGESIAILGSNGSGKSTLVRLIDALLPLERGDVLVNGISVRDRSRNSEIRKHIGIVFQDPDSQFVSPVLEEDIAFTPENYGIPVDIVRRLVDESLEHTGLQSFRYRMPQTLSGGEKERAQIAGILPLSPDIIILDEAFSMMDRAGRQSGFSLVSSLWRNAVKILVTHSADEAMRCSRVLLLSGGKIIADDKAEYVLSSRTLLERAGVRAPFALLLQEALTEEGIEFPFVTSLGDIEEALCSLL